MENKDHVLRDVEEDENCVGDDEAGQEEEKGILQMPFEKKWKPKRDFRCVIARFVNVRYVIIAI